MARQIVLADLKNGGKKVSPSKAKTIKIYRAKTTMTLPKISLSKGIKRVRHLGYSI